MIQKASGLLIHAVPYQDSNIICKIFTRELGVISCVANHARSSRKGAGKGVILQPLNFLNLQVYHNPEKQIHRLSEYQLKVIFLDIHCHFLKTMVSSFILELLHKTLKEDGANPELYDFLEESLIWFDQEAYDPNFHLWLMARLTEYLGIQPQNNYTTDYPFFSVHGGSFHSNQLGVTKSIEPPFSMYISELLQMNLNDLKRWKLNRTQRKQLLENWIAYYCAHLDGFKGLKSVEILERLTK